jgi:hypothetical protein
VADLEDPSPIDRFADIAKRLGIGNGTSIVKVELGGGGAALWISCTAAVLACFAAILMAIALLYVALQQANHGHQLNAIYRVAPSLEQQVKAELAKKEEAE